MYVTCWILAIRVFNESVSIQTRDASRDVTVIVNSQMEGTGHDAVTY
jgi:hypothetical protein